MEILGAWGTDLPPAEPLDSPVPMATEFRGLLIEEPDRIWRDIIAERPMPKICPDRDLMSPSFEF